jgi:hypothetical protein
MNINTHYLRIVTKSASDAYVYFISIPSTIRTQNRQCQFMDFILSTVTEKWKARSRILRAMLRRAGHLRTSSLLFNKAVVLSQTRKLQSMTTQNLYQGHQIELGRKVYYNARLASPPILLPRLIQVIQCSWYQIYWHIYPYQGIEFLCERKLSNASRRGASLGGHCVCWGPWGGRFVLERYKLKAVKVGWISIPIVL